MRRLTYWIALFLVGALACLAQESRVLVFEHVSVIDGVSPEPVRDVTVVVRDGKIESVNPGPQSIPAGAQRFDLTGRWLLPGLIDAHMHPMAGITSAHNLINAGVTTARSMLTANYLDVGLAALHRRGDPDIPEILAAGYPVVPYPLRFRPDLSAMFLDNPQLDDLRKDADIGVEGVRRLVRANLEHHVDIIKVFANERAGDLASDPCKRMLSDEELAAAVDEAHKAGVKVGTHAYSDDGAAAAVRAGVDTIEHGAYISDATLRLMRARNVYYVPTLAEILALVNVSGGASEDAAGLTIRARAMLPRWRETARHARQIGVKMIAGTDSDYASDNPLRIADEMVELVGIGMTSMEAIQAATSISAQCFGIANRTGSIRPGLEADFVVLDHNPLDGINFVRDIVLVVNDGRIVVNHLQLK